MEVLIGKLLYFLITSIFQFFPVLFFLTLNLYSSCLSYTFISRNKLDVKEIGYEDVC